MTFFFKKTSIPIRLPKAPSHAPLAAAWTRDPKTGRLVQTWREADDAEHGCTRRPVVRAA